MSEPKIVSLPPEEINIEHFPDDDELATEMVARWEGKLSYFYNKWHRYEQGLWKELHEAQIHQQIRDFLREKRRKFKKMFITGRMLSGVARMATLDCYVEDMLINGGREYLNLKNGLLNLTTLKLEPHRPELYFKWQLGFDYEPDADCPNFMNYLRSSLTLEDGNPDWRMIDLIQEAFGYSLTANTNRKAMFWAVGPKDSGKTTLIAVLRELMGAMHTTINMNDIKEDKYLLATLAGKRVATCTEADVGTYLPDGLLKMIVGGEDAVQANVKHKDPIIFIPECKIWWAMNEMPRTRDRSGAVHRRIHAIVFPNSIPEERQISGLLNRIKPEMAGILNWAIFGNTRLELGGTFTRPESSVRKMEEFRLMNDPEALFISECGILNPDLRTQASDLHAAITAWRKANGYQSKSTIQVRKELERLGVTRHKQNDANYYVGLALNEDGREYAGTV